MKIFLLLLLTCFSLSSWSQLNIDSVSHVDYNALHSTQLNDIWGYTDELNNEYALVGARKGVSIVDVTTPSNPQEVFWTQGMESVWRDLKTFGDYAYVTTEADNGLLIIDLTGLPSNTNLPITNWYDTGADFWSSAHNLWIDENGICYIFGANRGNGGVIMLDVATDPMNPTEVGEFDNWYCHDGYVRNDTMYLAHIFDGFISIVDVTDKSNPVLLGTKETATSFSHNIWLSDDGDYVFTTDEVSDSYIGSFDVSDPANIVEVDKIQSNPGTQTIPHNAHVLGDYLVTSYYADGITIHDISDPTNLIEVGNYDTYPGTSSATIGNWGAYPYFESGTLLATDIDYGLFILSPTYTPAAKIEGTITNGVSGATINDVEVNIENHNQTEFSDLSGFYKGGIAQNATRNVTYNKYSFEAQTIPTSFTQGTTVLQDVQLVPIDPFSITIEVLDANNAPIFDADVRLKNNLITLEGASDGAGEASFDLYYEVNYTLTVGKWGYQTVCLDQVIDASTNSITIILEEGIYDDFSFDFGWTAVATATQGIFVRTIPIGHGAPGLNTNPYGDSGVDCGEQAWVTGNGTIVASVNDHVTEGSVSLTSPVFDLTEFTDPHINYERFWVCRFGPQQENDTLLITLSNGLNSVVIEKQGPDPSTEGMWVSKSIRVADFITPTANMQINIFTEDQELSPNVTEVGFDHFFVSNQNVASVKDEDIQNEIKLYPNPVKNKIQFLNIDKNTAYIIYNQLGKKVLSGNYAKEIDVTDLNKGMYFVQIGERRIKFIKS